MTEALTDAEAASRPAVRRYLVLIPVLAALLVGTRGIADEAAVSLQGDMPRYLMNGVFLMDAVKAMPLGDPLGYAQQYYARYPALSLGHHPLLLPAALVPAFAALGVSVFAARVLILAFLLTGVVLWYRLVARYFGEAVAVFSTLLLVLTPSMVVQSQSVLSEVPTWALIVASLACLDRYVRTGRTRDAVLFALAVAASAWSKQLAIFMMPVYAAYFLIAKGWRAAFSRDVVIAGLVIGVLVAPIVPMTLRFSKFNMTVVTKYVEEEKGGRFTGANLFRVGERILNRQLTTPLKVLVPLALIAALVRRERRVWLPVLWLVLLYAGLTALGVFNVRFAFYLLPAVCLLAASPLASGASRRWSLAWTSLLVVAVGFESASAAGIKPAHAGGYERAAEYVLGRSAGRPVLYSARVDTGYFVFFVRKHDPEGQALVLRADKLFTTSRMNELNVDDRIDRPEQIYEFLRTYGVRFVVLEDTEYPPGPLTWLRDELRTNRFTLAERIPVASNDRRLQDTAVNVYEFTEPTTVSPLAKLSLNIPLIGETIEVKLRDLLPAETKD